MDCIHCSIASGEHVAIVGASGAGKSTLTGLLLGWHRPATGVITIDGHPLDATTLQRLRDNTAWLDPTVQLWNQSLIENLFYGNDHQQHSMQQALEDADLYDTLARLEDGLQTSIGASGGLLSGGEGQRVRLGRALGASPCHLGRAVSRSRSIAPQEDARSCQSTMERIDTSLRDA